MRAPFGTQRKLQKMLDEKRLADSATQLLSALEKAREDINWMLNERQFLNGNQFDYIDEAIKQAKGQ